MTAQNLPTDRDVALGELWRRVQILEAVASSGGEGLQFNSGTYGPDNVGDWLVVEASGSITGGFSQPSLCDPDGFSVAITTMNGVLITAMDGYNQGDALVVEVDQPGSDNAHGIGSLCSSDTGEVLALDIIYDQFSATSASSTGASIQGTGKTSGPCRAIIATNRNDGTSGDSLGVDVISRATAGGNSIGVRSRARVSGGGAAFCYEGYSSLGVLIFQIDNAGNIHIPTGAAVIPDL